MKKKTLYKIFSLFTSFVLLFNIFSPSLALAGGGPGAGKIQGDEGAAGDELSVEEKLGVDSTEGIFSNAVGGNTWKRLRTGVFVFGAVYIVWRFFFKKKK